MSSVTFRDGFTVSDDSNVDTGLRNGGHRLRFIPALSRLVSTTQEAKDWANKLNDTVFDGAYSAKEHAVGTMKETGGSAKAWATELSFTVDYSEYSAKEYAIGTAVPAGSAKAWATSNLPIGADYSAKMWAIDQGTVPMGSSKAWAVGGMLPVGFKSSREYSAEASASAMSALNAPGTTATSTTSNSIPTAFPTDLTFVIQPNKFIIAGQFVIAASTLSPNNYVIGQIKSYNSTTGSLVITVSSVSNTGGSGTFNSWSIGLTVLANVAGTATLNSNNTLAGVNTFTHPTSPIVTTKLGPSEVNQHSLPNVTSDVIVLVNANQTIANKTITASQIVSPVITGTGTATLSSVRANSFSIDDNAFVNINSSRVRNTVDTNDNYEFDRTTNTFNWSVNNTNVFAITPNDGPSRTTDGTTSNALVRKSQVDNLLQTKVRAGSIHAFAYAENDDEYLFCDGRAVSRTTYSVLFSKIGTTYGVGDGSTTFNLPDYRAEFLRGFDAGRGVDTGRVFPQLQLDRNRGHYHGTGQYTGRGNDDLYTILRNWAVGSWPGKLIFGELGRDAVDIIGGGNVDSPGTTGTTDDISAGNNIDARPRNVPVYYCIKT